LGKSADLCRLLPEELPEVWDTKLLANLAGIKRGVAQRIAYVLRSIGAVEEEGKQGNSRLYRVRGQRAA
jgi:hypothetical protein